LISNTRINTGKHRDKKNNDTLKKEPHNQLLAITILLFSSDKIYNTGFRQSKQRGNKEKTSAYAQNKFL